MEEMNDSENISYTYFAIGGVLAASLLVFRLYYWLCPTTEHRVKSLCSRPDVCSILDLMESWAEFDVFTLFDICGTYTIAVVGYVLFEELKAQHPHLAAFSDSSICEFFFAVSLSMNETTFHNSLHVADVMVRCLMLARHSKVRSFSGIELFALLIAAACHDLDHDGTDNKYHLAIKSPLAMNYQSSPLEHHHANTGWALVSTFLLDSMSPEERDIFEKIFFVMILSTDMDNHNQHVKQLSDLRESDFTKFDDRVKLLEAILHAADISNVARPFEQATLWADRVFEEFFLLGDAQKAQGIEVGMLNDRAEVDINSSEVGWIKYILPLYMNLKEILPDGDAAITCELLEQNSIAFHRAVVSCPSTPLSDSGFFEDDDDTWVINIQHESAISL